MVYKKEDTKKIERYNDNDNNQHYIYEHKKIIEDVEELESVVEKIEYSRIEFEKDYAVFKKDISHNLDKLTNNIVLLTNNINKLNDLEKTLIEVVNNNKNQDEKIKNINNKIDWIAKLIIGTVIIALIQFFFEYKKDRIESKSEVVKVEEVKKK